jgi:hypothetical protein
VFASGPLCLVGAAAIAGGVILWRQQGQVDHPLTKHSMMPETLLGERPTTT